MTIISRTIAVWDIDTTIANNDHRAVLLDKLCTKCQTHFTDHSHRSKCQACGCETCYTPQECWDKFLDPGLVSLDTPEPDAQRVIAQMRKVNMDFFFVTGRNAGLRDVTETWLKQHFGWDKRETLYMRPLETKNMPASRLKEQLLQQLMEENRLNPKLDNFLFFEDDHHVFGMYEKYGIVIKCPEGLKHFCPPGLDRTEEPSWKR